MPVQVQRGFRPYALGETLGIEAGTQRGIVPHQFGQPGFQPRQIQPLAAVFAEIVHRHAAERPLFAAAEEVSLLQRG